MYHSIPQEKCTRKSAQDFALKMLIEKNKATRGTEVRFLSGPTNGNTLMFRPCRKRSNSPECLDVSLPNAKKSKSYKDDTSSNEGENIHSQDVAVDSIA